MAKAPLLSKLSNYIQQDLMDPAETSTDASIKTKQKKISSTTPKQAVAPTLKGPDATTLKQLIAQNGGNTFSADQLAAIRFSMTTHLRIIAGAGSGKTQTICAKAAYLVQAKNIDPKTIMMCTFSRKAKLEMEARVSQYLNGQGHIAVKTFHGWFNLEFNRLIKQFPALKKWGIEGEIDEEQYLQSVNQLIKKYRLYNFDKYEDRSIVTRISYWRNLGYSDQAIIQFVAKYFDAKELVPNQTLSVVFKNFLAELEQIKRAQHFINFDDMLVNLKLILENDQTARQTLQQKYRYIFIDEFQDINPLQQQIISLICPPDKTAAKKDACKLIIVGDDDQSIYYFRGAEPRFIKEFDQNYQQTSLNLMTNYRSDAPIVASGNQLIKGNSHDRLEKTMTSFHTDTTHDCYAIELPDEDEEATWIGQKIQELAQNDRQANGQPNYMDTLILYPTRVQLRSLLKQLEKQKVPFVTQSNDDLMGIFGLPLFKNLFEQLVKLKTASSAQTRSQALKNVIQQYAFYHYVKFGTSANFIDQLFAQNKFKINELVAFLVKEKKLNTAAQQATKDFFKQIYFFYQGKELNTAVLAKTLLTTPKFKQDLSEEEADWLEKELNAAKNWTGLMATFDQAKTRNQNMKQRLSDYDQHKLNAVYLLSIHASKGLGKKNIFVKGVYQDALPNHHTVKKSEINLQQALEQGDPPTTLEEQRRLMYVAITRAKENLYVTFPKTVNDKPTALSPFIKEAGLTVKQIQPLTNQATSVSVNK